MIKYLKTIPVMKLQRLISFLIMSLFFKNQVILASWYRIYTKIMDFIGIQTKICWTVTRGEGLSPIESCEGKFLSATLSSRLLQPNRLTQAYGLNNHHFILLRDVRSQDVGGAAGLVRFPDVRGLSQSPVAGKTGITWGLLHFPSGSWAAVTARLGSAGTPACSLPGSLAFVQRAPQGGLLGPRLSSHVVWLLRSLLSSHKPRQTRKLRVDPVLPHEERLHGCYPSI